MPRKRPVIAPLPISASLSLRVETPPVTEVPKTGAGGSGSCRVRCSGDRTCVCRADVPHFWHLCRNPECICREMLRESASGVAK
jgi:hypothetical protein